MGLMCTIKGSNVIVCSDTLHNDYSWYGTRPSEQARSMVSMVMWSPAGQWTADHDARKHMIAEGIEEKLILHRIQ